MLPETAPGAYRSFVSRMKKASAPSHHVRNQTAKPTHHDASTTCPSRPDNSADTPAHDTAPAPHRLLPVTSRRDILIASAAVHNWQLSRRGAVASEGHGSDGTAKALSNQKSGCETLGLAPKEQQALDNLSADIASAAAIDLFSLSIRDGELAAAGRWQLLAQRARRRGRLS